GVVLNGWEALYAEHAVGGAPSAITYRIVIYSTNFTPPSNWLLVAAVNGDDGTMRLGTGQILGTGQTTTAGKIGALTSTYFSSLDGSALTNIAATAVPYSGITGLPAFATNAASGRV